MPRRARGLLVRCIAFAVFVMLASFEFRFNHRTQYCFNFAQAADDIIAPKTDTRGEVYETYLTRRISDTFLLKGSYINYNCTWSGSGWQVGAPKRLNSTPLLGFPTHDGAKMFTVGLIAEF